MSNEFEIGTQYYIKLDNLGRGYYPDYQVLNRTNHWDFIGEYIGVGVAQDLIFRNDELDKFFILGQGRVSDSEESIDIHPYADFRVKFVGELMELHGKLGGTFAVSHNEWFDNLHAIDKKYPVQSDEEYDEKNHFFNDMLCHMGDFEKGVRLMVIEDLDSNVLDNVVR